MSISDMRPRNRPEPYPAPQRQRIRQVTGKPTGFKAVIPRLQKGLVPADKARRVANHVDNMVHEVGVIAHSCGNREPRELRRKHARVVIENGNSIPLDEMYKANSMIRLRKKHQEDS